MSVEIIQNTYFTDDEYARQLIWDERLGFAVSPAEQGDTMQVLGYYTPPVVDGPLPEVLYSRTTYQGLAKDERSIDLQGKGIGARLYNTPAALTGLRHYSTYVGAYSIELSRSQIHDMRQASDAHLWGKAMRIGQHAGRMIQTRLVGLERTTDAIHAQFPGGTQAVLHNQPPNAARREHTFPEQPAVASAFMVIRDASLAIRKRGEAGLV